MSQTTDGLESQPLTLESSLDLLLVLLYAPGTSGTPAEPIDGITRLQKLIFLLNQGKGPASVVAQAKEFLYEPYKMGPFSRQVNEDLDILISLDLVRTEKLKYLLTDDADDYDDADSGTRGKSKRRVESLRFFLTNDGREAAAETQGRDPAPLPPAVVSSPSAAG